MKQLLVIIVLLSTLYSCSRPEVIFIDGVAQPGEQFRKLDSSEIFSHAKYEHGEAPARYNKGGDTVVIVVKTKKVETQLQEQRHRLLNRFLDSVDNGVEILIVEEGAFLTPDAQQELRKLSPAQLSNVDTMAWPDAKELYGSKATQPTLIINLYKPQKLKYHPSN